MSAVFVEAISRHVHHGVRWYCNVWFIFKILK